jgi:hypothetical protein
MANLPPTRASYDELLPACTSYGEALIGPPQLEVARANRSLHGRLATSVKEIFDFYERAQSWLPRRPQ